MEATTSELNLFLMPYIRAFQMLCISHFSIFRPELYKNRWRSVPYLVYFLLFISSHVVLTYFDCQLLLNMENKPNDKYSPLILLVNVMSVCGNFINHATLHIEALVQGKKERKLYRILNEINDIFATKLNHSMDYKGLRRKYARNMIPFFVIMAAVMFSVVYNSLSSLENRYMFMVFRIYTVIIICSREMYIALTLGILGDFLIHLKDALSNDSDQFQERIRYFRQIYSKIGLIKDLISDCFGWSLITFLIQFTFDLINLSYWLFINLTILKATVLSMIIVCHITEILLTFGYFCKLAERCQNTGRAIGRTLHAYPQNVSQSCRRIIRLFSLQIMQNPIEITIKELFTFNYVLLKSTTIFITTYAVIIIQFQISEENASKSTKSTTN